jgi:hypothetical protein
MGGKMITPAFDLDFIAASLDARVTFTRTTSASNPATYVDSNGYITAATNDQPRFDYDSVTLACKGLLIEESRTNARTYSSDFGQATAWVLTNITTNASAETAPDGVSMFSKLLETTANANHRLDTGISVSSGTTYTQSVFVKAAERTKFEMYFATGFSATPRVTFDVANGTITVQPTGNSSSATITAFKNGVYRCTLTAVADSTNANGAVRMIRLLNESGSSTYVGDVTKGIYAWGAQLEVGASATSYIPTTSAALTRNADVATMTGTNFSSFWQASKGGVLVRARPSTVSGTRPWVQFDDGTADNIIALRGNTTNPELYIVDSGTPQAQIDAGTIAANTDYSMTAWWQTNDCKARLDSGAVVTDTTATIPTVTQARLGSDGTNYLNGHLASINYYDTFSQRIYTRRKNKAVFNLM